MPRAIANGIEIEYETFGDDRAAALLLISGLGGQLISWDESFCSQLADRGFRVIRFDNRDSGLSTHLDSAGPPDIPAVLRGEARSAYQLDDLAADAVGLLDHLGIDRAHIVGLSMGGYVAQLVAINHPSRVRTLTLMLTGPQRDEAVPAKPEGTATLLLPPAATREERIEQSLAIRRVLIGPGDQFEESRERPRAARRIDRAYYPVGTARQLAAILTAQPRLERLSRLHVPALVIHGVEDVLVPIENGRLVAAAVPGARLIEFEGMGHDLPKRVWPEVLDAIDRITSPLAREVGGESPGWGRGL